VQERLGHASIAITLDSYSLVIRQFDVDAAVTFANIVKADSPEARLWANIGNRLSLARVGRGRDVRRLRI